MRQAEQREAFRESLDLLSELVDILPSADPRWLDVLEAMYWQAEWVVDHRAETRTQTAIRALRAIDGLLADSADDARRATVKFRLANFLAWGTGELPEAEETCREAVLLYEAAGARRQALLARREIGWIRYLRGDIAGMTEESAQVVAAAEASGDRFVAMQGLVTFGYSNILRVRFADAESAIRHAVEIAEQDAKAYRLTMALSLLAAAVALQGRSAESAALFEQARSANPAFRDTILIELETFVHWVAGDFTSAVATARELAAWVIGGPKRRALGLACGPGGGRDGRPARGGAPARAGPAGAGRSRLGVLLSLHALRGGGPGLACGARSRVCGHAGRGGGRADRHGRPRRKRVRADRPGRVGRRCPRRAHRCVSRPAARGRGPRRGLAPHRGLAAAAAAWAALQGGRPDVAVAQAREAVGLLSEAGWRSHLGRAHDVLGRSLAAAGRPGAVAELDQAAVIFTQCGAAWRRDRTIQALRRLGSGGRRTAAAMLGPVSLTRREREVARLAARGMSAKAIAQALFVGERTVESHLSSTYAKLGVESKVDLIRRAAELGLS